MFSKGLYSSWCQVIGAGPDMLFDAGEGAATAIGNGLTNIEHCFLGHFHGDHTLGLPSIVGCRNMAHGTSRNIETRSHNKPLTIHYPGEIVGTSGRESFADLRRFVESRNRNWLRYDLMWHEMEPDETVSIGTNLAVRAFSMEHQKNGLTLGYAVIENRRRLREQFRGQNIRALKTANGWTDNDVMEPYEKNVFSYCLDSFRFDPKNIAGADIAVMDCTFLDPRDRDDPTHFTFDESFALASGAGVGTMIAAHISSRYGRQFRPTDQTYGSGMKVRVVDPDNIFDL